MIEVAEKIDELNERFYALYGRLYENGEQLTREQTASIAKKLLAQYERAYEMLCLREEIEQARELYELRLERGALIPRTWRFLFFRRKYNRAAVISGEAVAAKVERRFAARLQDIAAQTPQEGAEAPEEAEDKLAKEDPREGAEMPEKGTAEREDDAGAGENKPA